MSREMVGVRFGVKPHNVWTHMRWLLAGKRSATKPLVAYALEFLILTAVRKGQAVGARWEDIDFEDRVWDCPPEGHKTGKKTGQYHIVPLSDAAMAVLEKMKELQRGNESEFVFPGGSRSGHMSVAMVNIFMKRFGRNDAVGRAIKAGKIAGGQGNGGEWYIDAVPHGFRTTFKVWAVEHGYPEEDSEMALAHTVGSAVRNVYARFAQRIEPRRLMMQAWAEHCGRTEPLDAKVIPMRSTAK
jgi:integrase